MSESSMQHYRDQVVAVAVRQERSRRNVQAAAFTMYAALVEVERGIEVGTQYGIEESIDWAHYLTIIRSALTDAGRPAA